MLETPHFQLMVQFRYEQSIYWYIWKKIFLCHHFSNPHSPHTILKQKWFKNFSHINCLAFFKVTTTVQDVGDVDLNIWHRTRSDGLIVKSQETYKTVIDIYSLFHCNYNSSAEHLLWSAIEDIFCIYSTSLLHSSDHKLCGWMKAKVNKCSLSWVLNCLGFSILFQQTWEMVNYFSTLMRRKLFLQSRSMLVHSQRISVSISILVVIPAMSQHVFLSCVKLYLNDIETG